MTKLMRYVVLTLLTSAGSAHALDDIDLPSLVCNGSFSGLFKSSYGTIPQNTPFDGKITINARQFKDSDPASEHGSYIVTNPNSRIELSTTNHGTASVPLSGIGISRGVPGRRAILSFRPSLGHSGSLGGRKQTETSELLLMFRHDDPNFLVSDKFPISVQWSDFNSARFQLKAPPFPHFSDAWVDSFELSCDLDEPESPVPCNQNKHVHHVTDYGATPSDGTDDYQAIKNALSCAKHGDTVIFTSGLYHTSKPLTIVNKALEIKGEGIRTGLFQMNAGMDLLHITNATGARIRDIFLGARTPKSGENGSLLKMTETRYSRIDNVHLQGGFYGINLIGSLSNSFYDVRSGNNVTEPYEACPVDELCNNQQWISITPTDRFQGNANRFYNLQLEGGRNGILFDQTGKGISGSFSLYGGIISVFGEPEKSIAGKAIEIVNNRHPILISGMHIESGNVHLKAANHVSIENSVIIAGTDYFGGGSVIIEDDTKSNNSRNTMISNSIVDRLIEIGEHSTRTVLFNILQGLSEHPESTAESRKFCDPCIDDKAGLESDTLYINVTGNSALKSRSTLGFGVRNPVFDSSRVRMELRGVLK